MNQKNIIHSSVDYNIIFDNTIVDGIALEVVDIGNLHVPSGKIVVCDPLIDSDSIILVKKLKPGEYPVKVYIADIPEHGKKVALAKLEITDNRVVTWELAHFKDDALYDPGEGQFPGFAGESGLASYADYLSSVRYNEFADDYLEANPENDIFIHYLDAEFKKQDVKPEYTGLWLNYRLPGDPDLNLIFFGSGKGDGVYPSYWGMDVKGKVCCLVTDFLLLLQAAR